MSGADRLLVLGGATPDDRPDTLQSLETGQAMLVTKNPHRANVIEVYTPERPDEVLDRFNIARRRRGREPLGFDGLARLHRLARAATPVSANPSAGGSTEKSGGGSLSDEVDDNPRQVLLVLVVIVMVVVVLFVL